MSQPLVDWSELNLIERMAVRFLRSRNGLDEPRVHRWPKDELRTIRRLEISAIMLAAFSGMVSGALIGGLEIWLNFTFTDTGESWARWLEYWVIFLVVSVLISAIEILFLYWVVLWRVARISNIAGLRLSDPEVEQVVAIGLSRSALDIPDPRKPFYGVDPYIRVPRWRLIAYAILYRLKIGATSFIVRVLLRRALARAAVRALIPLVAIVIYAIWNAIIIGWIMQASRVRAAGPIAIQELGEQLLAMRPDLDEGVRRLLLEAVAETIIRSANDHPNFVLLLGRLFEDLEIEPGSLDLDWSANRSRIPELSAREQDLLLNLVKITILLDGRPRRKQLQFLQEIHEACGQTLDKGETSRLFRSFAQGQGIGALRDS